MFLFFFFRIFCEFKGSVVRCFKGIWVWDKNWTLDFFFLFFEGERFCVDVSFRNFIWDCVICKLLVIRISMILKL